MTQDESLKGARVLVVEDELLVSWMVEDMLTDLGCLVVGPACSVAQALEAVAAGNIDLAVLDVNLNGEMSYPVADALAAIGVPYVFSTGYQKGELREAYQTRPLLQKPLRGADLRDTLKSLLLSRPGRGA
jgi:CheY-like chemotaxis protein